MVGAYKCWSGLNSWTNQLVLVLSTNNSYQTGSGIGYFKKLSYQAWCYKWYKAGMTSGPYQASIGPGHTNLVHCLLPVLIPVFVPGTGLFPDHQQWCIPYVVSVPTKPKASVTRIECCCGRHVTPTTKHDTTDLLMNMENHDWRSLLHNCLPQLLTVAVHKYMPIYSTQP
jgi:hypothetical protein